MTRHQLANCSFRQRNLPFRLLVVLGLELKLQSGSFLFFRLELLLRLLIQLLGAHGPLFHGSPYTRLVLPGKRYKTTTKKKPSVKRIHSSHHSRDALLLFLGFGFEQLLAFARRLLFLFFKPLKFQFFPLVLFVFRRLGDGCGNRLGTDERAHSGDDVRRRPARCHRHVTLQRGTRRSRRTRSVGKSELSTAT